MIIVRILINLHYTIYKISFYKVYVTIHPQLEKKNFKPVCQYYQKLSNFNQYLDTKAAASLHEMITEEQLVKTNPPHLM